MFRALIPPIFRSTKLYVTACGIMHPRCCRRPKHVELIGILNKPLLLHLVGVCITYINDVGQTNIKFIDMCWFLLHIAPAAVLLCPLLILRKLTLVLISHNFPRGLEYFHPINYTGNIHIIRRVNSCG